MSKTISKLMVQKKQEFTDIFSPTFCIYPWVQFIFGPSGENIKLCCLSKNNFLKDKSGQYYSFKTHTLDEIWNGTHLKEIRKKMLKGEKIKHCQQCYNYEHIGSISLRNWSNKEWLSDSSPYKEFALNKVKKSINNDYRTSPPNFLDIRFGNFCNLQCRMCSPENSSKIQEEYEQLIKQYKEKKSHFGNDLELLKKNKNWYKNKNLLKDIYSWTPYLKKIYLTGGEPTLIKENWDLINHLNKKNYAKDITLQMSTNCTHMPDKFLNMLHSFKNVQLLLSIDGYKEINEYIRYPSKWKIIENNTLRILEKKSEKIDIIIFPTLQIYNILYITELFKWTEGLNQINKISIYSDHFQTDHEKLDINILPKNVKQICLDKILSYETEHKGTYSTKENKLHNLAYFYDGLDSVKNVLKSPSPSDFKHHLTDFRKYTEMLDKKRGNSFQKTFPELYELLKQDGSWR